MPYALEIPEHIPRCLNWSDLPQTPEESWNQTLLRRTESEALPLIPYVQAHHEEDLTLYSVPTTLPVVLQGRWSQNFFYLSVSRKSCQNWIRSLIFFNLLT